MANNYSQSTVQPFIPCDMIELWQIEVLHAMGFSSEMIQREEEKFIYIYVEEGMMETIGLEDVDESVHSYVDPENVGATEFDAWNILHQILRQWQTRAPETASKYLYVQGADTCDKLRPDNFGGFAVFITAEGIETTSTWDFIHNHIAKTKE